MYLSMEWRDIMVEGGAWIELFRRESFHDRLPQFCNRFRNGAKQVEEIFGVDNLATMRSVCSLHTLIHFAERRREVEF
jgi:hypothetical protein